MTNSLGNVNLYWCRHKHFT